MNNEELIEKLKSFKIQDPQQDTALLAVLREISTTNEPKSFDKFELNDSFMPLIQTATVKNKAINREAAKCIAEITKSEIQRKKFTTADMLSTFLECLRNRQIDATDNLELVIQICRALGNICYLNDDARKIILDQKGDEVLLSLLDDRVNVESEVGLQFVKVRSGLISNYLLGDESFSKRAMDLNIIGKIQFVMNDAMENVEKNEDILLSILPLLSILTEHVADLNFEEKLNIQMSRILQKSTNPDLAEMCLELLQYQAENDDVKLYLAKDGLCETIFKLLEKYKNLANSSSESRALMKLACDLIVLILLGDESMNYLYTSPLLKAMESWLDETDTDLLTTAVLALGNFARTDSHCIHFVESQIMHKLLAILAKNNRVEDDMRLQHALLSALRNLVIPKANKAAVIEAGLVNTIIPMLEIHQPPVVFKLLGTLRMTIDGQEKLALDLLKNKKLIEQLVLWSKSSDYVGVTGESQRLMAWLIKHAYLHRVMQSSQASPKRGDESRPTEPVDLTSLKCFVCIQGSVESMINMLASQHLIMQNESLIALCILTVVFLCDSTTQNDKDIDLEDMFIRFNIGKQLSDFVKRSSDNMTKEMVDNLQNFIRLLRSSEKMNKHLEEHNISESLKSIPKITEYCTL